MAGELLLAQVKARFFELSVLCLSVIVPTSFGVIVHEVHNALADSRSTAKRMSALPNQPTYDEFSLRARCPRGTDAQGAKLNSFILIIII